MKKLISRNPVLRFKLGRKIVKAYDGVELNVPSLSFFPSKSPRISYGLNPDDIIKAVTEVRTPTSSYLEPETPEAKKQREDYFNRKKRELGFDNTSEVSDYRKALESNYYSQLGKGRSYTENGNNYWIGSDGSKTLISGKVVGKDGKEYWKGSDGSMTLLKSNKSTKNSKTSSFAKAFNEARQSGLLEFVWNGGRYNTKNKGEENFVFQNGKWVAPQSTVENIPLIEQIPEVSGIYSSLNPSQISGGPVIDINKISSTGKFYNRADVRNYMRRNGFNPYNYTADYRIALRKVLNGQGSQDDYNMVRSMGIKFKKGGLLPSRNSIQRFKNRNFN